MVRKCLFRCSSPMPKVWSLSIIIFYLLIMIMKKAFLLTLSLVLLAASPLQAQVYADMLLSDKAHGHKEIQSLSVPGDVNVYDNLHHHGPAFESELVAYRLYFDHRQTVDIYGKRHKGLELKHTEFYPTADDIANGYGDDVLWAGTSLSCGSFRGFADHAPSFIQPVDKRTESILEYGPDRIVVEIKDEGWYYGGQKLDMVQHYTLEAWHRDVRVDIDIKGSKPFMDPFCTGVLKFPNGTEMRTQLQSGHCAAASWGSNWAYGPKDTLNVNRHATVGVAVCVPQKYVCGSGENGVDQYFLLGNKKPRKQFHATYWLAFCSAKEEWEGSMHSADEWFAWVEEWRKLLKE